MDIVWGCDLRIPAWRLHFDSQSVEPRWPLWYWWMLDWKVRMLFPRSELFKGLVFVCWWSLMGGSNLGSGLPLELDELFNLPRFICSIYSRNWRETWVDCVPILIGS